MRPPTPPSFLLLLLLLHPLCSDSRLWTSVSALRGAACSSPVFMSGWLAGGVTTKLLQTDIFSSSGLPIICQINPADHLCAPSLLRAPNHHPIVFFFLSFYLFKSSANARFLLLFLRWHDSRPASGLSALLNLHLPGGFKRLQPPAMTQNWARREDREGTTC